MSQTQSSKPNLGSWLFKQKLTVFDYADDPNCFSIYAVFMTVLVLIYGSIPFVIGAVFGTYFSTLTALLIGSSLFALLYHFLKDKEREAKQQYYILIIIAVSSLYGFVFYPLYRALYRFLYADFDFSNLPVNTQPNTQPSSSVEAGLPESGSSPWLSLAIIGAILFGTYHLTKKPSSRQPSTRPIPKPSQIPLAPTHQPSPQIPSSPIISNISSPTLTAPSRPLIPAPFITPTDSVSSVASTDSLKSPTLERRQDVTAELKDLVQEVVDATCISNFIGIGRDARLGGYDRLEVVRVERIHNKHMSLRYYLERDILSDKYQMPLQTVRYETYREWAVKQFSLKGNLNEALLFHGTKPEYVDKIIADGFEERKSNTSGLFGGGIYFADHSSKSDEYVTSDSKGNCYLFFARVLLGDPYKSLTSQNDIRMPPEDKDSVLGLCKRKGQPRAFLEKYPEYVVYDGNRCYPELLVTYKRTRKPRPGAGVTTAPLQNCSIM